MFSSRLGSVILLTIALLGLQPAMGFTFLDIPNRCDYAYDQSGILYVSTTDGKIDRYNTRTSSYLTPWTVGGSLCGIDLSPDGSTLAVADTTMQGANNRIVLIDTRTGSAQSVSFVADYGEAGTFMTAWGVDNQVLVTSNWNGSGGISLRRYDPQTGQTVIVARVNQSSMLTPSADRKTIAIAEPNGGNGPIDDYDVLSHSLIATTHAEWYVYEVAVSRDGGRYVVPTYGGAYVYSRTGATFSLQGTIGKYADHAPVAAVFSPLNDVFFSAEQNYGIRVYDANTLMSIATIDLYNFDWCGNGAMGSGRMEISRDGSTLAVSIDNGVRLYDVRAYTPEPATVSLLTLSGLAMLRRRK